MRYSVLLLLTMVLLPACGQKGPLYLPSHEPAAAAPATPAPASRTQPDRKTSPAPAGE